MGDIHVDATQLEVLEQGRVLERPFFDQFEGYSFFFFTRRRFDCLQAWLRTWRGRMGVIGGEMRGVEAGAFQHGERLAHVALIKLSHEVDDVAAAHEPMVEPYVFAGIDLERGGFVAFADRAVILQLSTAEPDLHRVQTTTLKIDVNRDSSGLVSTHRSKLSGKVGEGKHI